MADEALMMADEPPDAIRDLAVGVSGTAGGLWRCFGAGGGGMQVAVLKWPKRMTDIAGRSMSATVTH